MDLVPTQVGTMPTTRTGMRGSCRPRTSASFMTRSASQSTTLTAYTRFGPYCPEGLLWSPNCFNLAISSTRSMVSASLERAQLMCVTWYRATNMLASMRCRLLYSHGMQGQRTSWLTRHPSIVGDWSRAAFEEQERFSLTSRNLNKMRCMENIRRFQSIKRHKHSSP